MWNNKMKAVTFSYDDGVCQDKRLVGLFNQYQLKATFNLNSGIQSGAGSFEKNGIVIKRMNIKGLKELYAGHEIAAHGLTHASLTKVDEETVYNEIMYDKINLENIFECKVAGMAYAYGTYNEQVKRILGDCGIRYARTVNATNHFEVSPDLLELQPTCHHADEGIFETIDRFIRLKADRPQILYIWGHSYEFDCENNWEQIEKIAKLVSQKDDIFYGTNAEVLLG